MSVLNGPVIVRKRNAYGAEHLDPVNEAARFVVALAGTRVLRRDAVNVLKAAGVSVILEGTKDVEL